VQSLDGLFVVGACVMKKGVLSASDEKIVAIFAVGVRRRGVSGSEFQYKSVVVQNDTGNDQIKRSFVNLS